MNFRFRTYDLALIGSALFCLHHAGTRTSPRLQNRHHPSRRQAVLHRYHQDYKPGLIRKLQHANKHGRHPLTVSYLVFLNKLQRLFGIKLFHDDAGPTVASDAHRESQRRSMVARR